MFFEHLVATRDITVTPTSSIEEGKLKQFSDEEIKGAEAELAKVRKEWLRRPGVTAVDVGYKITDGRIVDVLAIRVFVKRKLQPEQLEDWEIFPSTLGEYAVDVVEAEFGPQPA